MQKLVLVITCLETNEVLERWQFDIECDKSAKESRWVKARPRINVYEVSSVYHTVTVLAFSFTSLCGAKRFHTRRSLVGVAEFGISWARWTKRAASFAVDESRSLCFPAFPALPERNPSRPSRARSAPSSDRSQPPSLSCLCSRRHVSIRGDGLSSKLRPNLV